MRHACLMNMSLHKRRRHKCVAKINKINENNNTTRSFNYILTIPHRFAAPIESNTL